MKCRRGKNYHISHDKVATLWVNLVGEKALFAKSLLSGDAVMRKEDLNVGAVLRVCKDIRYRVNK